MKIQERKVFEELAEAATVQVFGGVVDALTWAQTMDGPEAPGLLLPDTDPRGETNELFRGFIDDWDHSIEGTLDSLEVTARDLTQFFIDPELPVTALKGVPKDTSLDKAIHLLVLGDGLPEGKSKRPGLPGASGVAIVNETGADLPVLSKIKPPSWFDSKKTVKVGRRRSKANTKKITYWDMINDLCVSAGLIVFVRPGTKPIVDRAGRSLAVAAEIVITNPRTHYGKSTQYGNKLIRATDVRRFVAGLNCKVRMRRNLAGTARPTAVEFHAWDPGLGKGFEGRYPPKKKVVKASVSGKGDSEEVKVFVVRGQGGEGIQERLNAMAESTYEQIGRGEFNVSIRTQGFSFQPPDLSAPRKVDEQDPDIFRMRMGEPIEVTVDKGSHEQARVSSATLLEAETTERAADTMIAAGVRPDVARAIAAAARAEHLQTEFRSKTLMMNYSEGKWDFELKAINYLDVRHSLESTK